MLKHVILLTEPELMELNKQINLKKEDVYVHYMAKGTVMLESL